MILLVRSVLAVHAALLVLGGVMGYKKAGSRASLIAGSACGGLLLVALVWTFRSPREGAWVGAAASACIALIFAARLRRTRKLMPSGALLALSAIALGLLLYAVARMDTE